MGEEACGELENLHLDVQDRINTQCKQMLRNANCAFGKVTLLDNYATKVTADCVKEKKKTWSIADLGWKGLCTCDCNAEQVGELKCFCDEQQFCVDLCNKLNESCSGSTWKHPSEDRVVNCLEECNSA